MNNKLTETIKLFTRKELRQLNKFVESKYFNSGNKALYLIKLLEISVIELKKTDNSDSISKIHNQLFPGEEVVEGRIEKLMSALLKLIEQFIELNFDNDFFDKNQKLLAQATFFRSRKAYKFYQGKIKKVQSQLAITEIKDENYFLNKFFTAQEIENFNEQFNTRKEDLNLPTTLENLDIFFLYHRLKTTVSLLAQNIHTKIQIKSTLKLIELTSDLIKSEGYLQIPVIKIYFYAYTLLKDYGDENHALFLEFRNYLDEVSDQLPPADNKSLRTLVRIYAIGQYNLGKYQFLQEAFELYKSHLEKGFLFYEGKIRPSMLQNIIILGLRMEKFDWVYSFLQEYRHKITGTRQPDDVFFYNLAYYHFYQGAFEKSSELLNDFYEDFHYKVNAKRLEIQIFYEQKSPIFEHKLEAFKVYIFRVSKKNLPEKLRLGNNNFIDILKQILKPKTVGNPVRIEQIKTNIRKKKILAERDWLIEKVEEKY